MRKLNLRLFDDDPPTYSVTCLKDSGFSAFSASPGSGAKGTTVTLTITPASNKELDEIEVAAGGVTLETSEEGVVSFKIGEANVVLYAKSKADNLYKVTEETAVYINGAKTALHKNVEVVLTKQGAIEGVNCTGTAITVNDAVQNLIDQGVLVKI
jgi:hypothetical protein